MEKCVYPSGNIDLSARDKLKRICSSWVIWLCLLATLALLTGNATADVSYIYDGAGRVLNIFDGQGHEVTYSYDFDSNITSITTTAAPTFSVQAYSPPHGAAGTQVTIVGTGFSTTPSQNTVMFNGTAASVTASTASTITTSVPAGATTGAIYVTSPTGAGSGPTFTIP